MDGSTQLDSTQMAATRTLLALVRTGAAIAGGGPLVIKLLVNGYPRWVAMTLSSAFVVLGYWLIWMATRRGRRLRRLIAQERPGVAYLFPAWEVGTVTIGLQALIVVVLVLFLFQ